MKKKKKESESINQSRLSQKSINNAFSKESSFTNTEYQSDSDFDINFWL